MSYIFFLVERGHKAAAAVYRTRPYKGDFSAHANVNPNSVWISSKRGEKKSGIKFGSRGEEDIKRLSYNGTPIASLPHGIKRTVRGRETRENAWMNESSWQAQFDPR